MQKWQGVIGLALGCAGLQRLDVEVVRPETVPWHPAAGRLGERSREA
jgi:hypothetical protein